MEIEVWADIVCPFCWIGRRHLEQAMEKEGAAHDIVHRAFELDPRRAASEPLQDHLHRRFGPGAKGMMEQTARMGGQSGLDLRFDQAVASNTFDAHRIVHLGREHAMETAVVERLMAAHFTEGADLGASATLLRLGTEVGLPREEVQDVLGSGRFADAVRDEEHRAQALGIRGVPFFLIDGRTYLSGAQPVEAFRQVVNG